MKTCINCGNRYPIAGFYRHPRMADGHLNKCKECCKAQASKRYRDKKQDSEWVEAERARGREKYHRLGYRGRHKATREYVRRYMKNYKSNYPEKYRAHKLASRVKAPDGSDRHHWSYRLRDARDVIFLSRADHLKLHRFLEYDSRRMRFKDSAGNLLETREDHLAFAKSLGISPVPHA